MPTVYIVTDGGDDYGDDYGVAIDGVFLDRANAESFLAQLRIARQSSTPKIEEWEADARAREVARNVSRCNIDLCTGEIFYRDEVRELRAPEVAPAVTLHERRYRPEIVAGAYPFAVVESYESSADAEKRAVECRERWMAEQARAAPR